MSRASLFGGPMNACRLRLFGPQAQMIFDLSSFAR